MKLRWGVIGCGGIADRRTIPGMMDAENAELCAVMDANIDSAKRVCEKYGAKYAFDSIEELLKTDEIEAVYIASPVFCHLEQVEAAAKAKKHILLEKPLGLDVKEAEKIEKICKKYGVKLCTAFMMRFHAYHQKIREIIQSGALGEIVSARAQFTCWYPEMANVWRQNKKLSGGGALMDLGVHSVDLIRYITGLEAEYVSSMSGNQIFKYSVEDAGSIMMKLSNGAIAYVDSNFNVPDEASESKLEFYGTKGCIIASNTLSQVEGGEVKLILADDSVGYDAMQQRDNTKVSKIDVEFGNMYTKEITAFGEAVLDNKEVAVSASDAIKTQKIIDAAYKSSQTKKFIKIN